MISLNDVINKNAVGVELNAASKEQALSLLTDKLLADGAISDKSGFLSDVYLRESEGRTGIGGAIAIPHGKSDFVEKTCIAIGSFSTPIPWESLDNEPVKVIILFAVNRQDKNDRFVKIMSQVARLIGRDEVCQRLRSAASSEEIVAIFEHP